MIKCLQLETIFLGLFGVLALGFAGCLLNKVELLLLLLLVFLGLGLEEVILFAGQLLFGDVFRLHSSHFV